MSTVKVPFGEPWSSALIPKQPAISHPDLALPETPTLLSLTVAFQLPLAGVRPPPLLKLIFVLENVSISVSSLLSVFPTTEAVSPPLLVPTMVTPWLAVVMVLPWPTSPNVTFCDVLPAMSMKNAML